MDMGVDRRFSGTQASAYAEREKQEEVLDQVLETSTIGKRRFLPGKSNHEHDVLYEISLNSTMYHELFGLKATLEIKLVHTP